MTNREIYDLLRGAGLTKEGACALLGNMAAESAMRPDNAQNLPGVEDADYTAAADMGAIDFVGDGVGYGLCQWTLASRKAKLLSFARARGVTVADAKMQVDFCVRELRGDFPGIWRTLTTSRDLTACTRLVLDEYENPKVKNDEARLQYAQKALEAFGGGAKPKRERAAVMAVQLAMGYAGYWDGADGAVTPAFLAAARRMLDDWEGERDE